MGAGAGQGSGDKVGAGECLGLASNADLWKEEEREKDMKMGTHWRVATDWRRRERCQYISDRATLRLSIKDQINQRNKQNCEKLHWILFFKPLKGNTRFSFSPTLVVANNGRVNEAAVCRNY